MIVEVVYPSDEDDDEMLSKEDIETGTGTHTDRDRRRRGGSRRTLGMERRRCTNGETRTLGQCCFQAVKSDESLLELRTLKMVQ